MNIAEYAITDLRSLQAVVKILHAQKKPYVVVTIDVWTAFYKELRDAKQRPRENKWSKFCRDIDALHCWPSGKRPKKPISCKGYVSFKVLEKYDV